MNFDMIFNMEITQKWQLQKPDNTIEKVSELEEALKSKSLDEIQKLLQEPDTLRSLVVRRGEKSKNYKIFLDGFDLLVKEKFGPGENLMSMNGKDLIDFLHEVGLPEQILAEITDVAYNNRNKELFFKYLRIIFENEENLKDKEMFSRAQHNLASWEATVNKDFQKSININRKILEETQPFGREVLVQKAKFGLLHGKKLRSKDKAKDFNEIAASMEKLGFFEGSVRAKQEAARAYLELAKNQTGNLRYNNLDKAQVLALDSLKQSIDIKYPNAEINSRRILANIYSEMGKKKEYQRKTISFGKKAEKLANDYEYKTVA